MVIHLRKFILISLALYMQPMLSMDGDRKLNEVLDQKLKNAVFALDLKKTEKYLQKGANPNCYVERSPLLVAFVRLEYRPENVGKQEQIVRKLLECRANPNLTGTYTIRTLLSSFQQSGPSALIVAARKNQTNICRMLLEMGADVGLDGVWALRSARENKNQELEDLLCNTYHVPKKKDDCCDQCSVQ